MLKSTKTMLESKAWKDSGLEFISEDENNTSKAYIRDKYGELWLTKSNIVYGNIPSIIVATNKTSYIINRFKEVHGDKYDYSKVEYKNDKTKVVVMCREHGEFSILNQHHLNYVGCSKCNGGTSYSTEEFITKAKEMHGNKFDYSKVEYVNENSKIIIICKIHGEFEIRASHHISKRKPQCCGICSVEARREYPKGWKYTNWEKMGNRSKVFDSFKVYIIECWNEEERFYKIGKTFHTVKKRFASKSSMPYEYLILKIYEGDAKYISELETKLQRLNKGYNHVPALEFGGMYECFSLIEGMSSKLNSRDIFK